MGTHESSRYVELLLKEELVAVAEGLEQGIYCWEEMDLPHDINGCTPLIIACRMGLTMVMHYLLESGADATLCNHSNQTALHVSQPELQGELLLALNRDLPQQMQLSDAAWRGDLRCLQDLMAQTDMMDLNKQNRDGLTPLMLAVRDVDLFERLQLPWKYQPVEVVKELLSLSVDTKILDKRSHTALWYLSQITSSKKEELLRTLNSAIQDELDEKTTAGSPAASPSSSPTRDCCTPGIKGESTKAVIAQNNPTNIYQDNRIGIDGSMEPKINIGKDSKDEGKRSSLTSSLPSLWDSRKTWDKTRPLHPFLKETFSIPVCPAPQFTQLSKSTPALMEPLLHASMLLQARANIYNRLRGGDTEDDIITQKMSLPTSLRTPKHLAPLDRRYRDVTCLASLEHPLPSKPTSTLPFSSKFRQKVERISMQSFRRSRGTRAGSEESNSCSSSSQEEEENVPQETDTIFGVLEKSLNLELVYKSDFQQLNSSGINNTTENTNITISDDRKDDTPIQSPIVRDIKAEMRHDSKKSANSDGSSFIAGEKDLTTVNISEDQILHKKSKPIKMIKRNDRKGKMSFHTNQSFNILARRNQNTSTTTKNGKNSPIHSKVKLRESKYTSLAAETPYQSNLPTMTPTISCKKTTDDMPITKRVSEPYQHMRLSADDKKVSNNSPNQFPRDLRSAGPSQKPALGVPLRARSAVDHVTYNDMFLKISQGDEGPAIYEMFATPMYENLRADNFTEKTKQVNTGLQVERQINRKKQRDQKTIEVNRRKQAQSEKYIRTKCKQHKRRDNVPKLTKKHIPPSGNKCHTVTSDCEEEEKQFSKMSFIGDDGKEISSSVIKRQKSSMLSIIEEELSNTVSKMDIPQQHTSATTSEAHLTKHTIHQEAHTPADSCATGKPELSNVTKLPVQPLINTWTSDRTVSPVYQSFLDEMGDEPLTDDLLRSLAEGLRSLEERDDEPPETEYDDGKEFSNNLPLKFKKLLNEGVSSGELHYTKRSCLDDAAITWTKGEVLGKGAYGTVYCGLTSQGQLIAVKQVVLDASTSDIAEREYDRLEREVELLKNLRHSNIVGFLGTGLCENIVSIFMEYVPGGSISTILSQFGPLPEKVFALYTRQILEGVAYLHANRVIHRDLKGNNIMLMPTGVVKLIDFGCARRINCLTLSKSDLLKSVHGTPYWMAPEVINETGHGRKSDIWSIGCTVFEMATGKPPLAHMAKMAALFYIGARKGLMPCLSDDFSTNAKGFVQACLTRDPSQRPSAEELLRHAFISHHSKVCKKPLN